MNMIKFRMQTIHDELLLKFKDETLTPDSVGNQIDDSKKRQNIIIDQMKQRTFNDIKKLTEKVNSIKPEAIRSQMQDKLDYISSLTTKTSHELETKMEHIDQLTKRRVEELKESVEKMMESREKDL